MFFVIYSLLVTFGTYDIRFINGDVLQLKAIHEPIVLYIKAKMTATLMMIISSITIIISI
jgi:hypothetical protein